jgi:hypothetical protein
LDLTRVVREIGRFRGRLRGLWLAHGALRLVLVAALLLILSFALDAGLALPLPVRQVSFALALVLLGAAAVRWLVLPLRAKIADDDLALAAEGRIPELEDRLISALQFRRQMEDLENPESRPMMRAVIEEAGHLSQTLGAARLLDPRRLLRPGLPAAGAAIAFLVLVLAAPATAGIWARRNLLLEDIPWPRATTLVVEGMPESGEITITRGQSFLLRVRAEGEIPDDVEVWFLPLDGGGARAGSRRMFQSEGQRDLFQYEFQQVAGSFRFWVKGGDDRDGEPVCTVHALIPPTIEEILAACRFPEYTRMAPETFREADLDLPEGTLVSLELRINMALASAEIAAEGRPTLPMTIGEGGRVAAAGIVADRTVRFSVRLTGADGQRNLPGSADFRIRAVPDRKPQVRVLYPATRPWHTPAALVPVKVLASDNYGVSRVSLFIRRGAEGDFHERPFTPEETSPSDVPGEVVAYAAIEAANLVGPGAPPLRPGDEITFYAEAGDNNGNVDRTDRYRIEVVSEEELTRRLSQQQAGLRQDILKTRREEQEPAWRDVLTLLEFLADRGSLEDADREGFKEILVRQSTVTRRLDRLATNLADVFNSYVLNRLTNPPATARLLLLIDDFLRADRTELSTVFKRELYQQLIADYRAGNIRDQRTLAVLIEIMEITLKICERTSPEAVRLLTGLSRGEMEKGVAEDLGRVRDLMADILADFRLLDVKMQQWETYAEIIEIVRDILNTEQKIRTGAENLNR